MIKILKYIVISLYIIAIVGFFLPFASLELSFFGTYRQVNFSLMTIFQNNSQDPLFGGGLGYSDLGEFISDLDEVRNVTNRAVLAAVCYGSSFLMVLVVLIFTILNKLKYLRILLAAIIVCLFIYAGHIISGIPYMIFDEIENMLGFFALFINFRGMLSISLGIGYWISLITMCVNFVILIPASFRKSKIEVTQENN